MRSIIQHHAAAAEPNISPNDPLTFGGVSALLALTAVVAVLVPAHRAMRVDPMIALRTV